MFLFLCFVFVTVVVCVTYLNYCTDVFGLVARVTTTSSVPRPIASTCTFSTPFNSSGFMPMTAVKEMQIRAALSNAFGLGGTNVYAWKGGGNSNRKYPVSWPHRLLLYGVNRDVEYFG
ncbi:uncharacterized protein [Rutidosis leptorrhynchoides]|uniref:uncharacterized protein isoform X2 n=1 Tax=Rutidosis leptorrhynchoides TaxID=125765 RepID=UPI003A9948D4